MTQMQIDWKKRVDKANEATVGEGIDYSRVKRIVKEALMLVKKKAGVCGTVCEDEEPQEFNDEKYDSIKKGYRLNRIGDIVFIRFAENKEKSKMCVAVVGAGRDVKSGSGMTQCVLEEIGWEWCEDRVLYIPLKNLGGGPRGGIGSEKCYPNCRNGVEQFIGEYLINTGIPILNYFSHKNAPKINCVKSNSCGDCRL